MLKLILSEHTPSILCLQETHFHNRNTHELRNFNCFHKNRVEQERASGGVAIYVKNNIDAQSITLTTDLEAVAVSVSLQRKVNICNIYIPPNKIIYSQDIKQILEQIPKPRIIIGDFNGHNTIWGSNTINTKGRIIATVMEELSLNLLNDGEKTRFNSYTGESSALDLSLCDPVLSPSLSWEVLPYLYGSDHHPIKISNNNYNADSVPTPKWRLNKADWHFFANIIEIQVRHIKDITAKEDIDQALDNFTNIIIQAAEKSIGKTMHIKRHTPVPWWSKECKEAIKLSKQAYNKYKRHKTTENLLAFKKSRARTRYIIKKSKKDSWIKYLSSINSSTSLTAVWNKVKKISGASS